MITIMVNGTEVQVDSFTFARIEKIARVKKLTIPEAVSYCLEKVI